MFKRGTCTCATVMQGWDKRSIKELVWLWHCTLWSAVVVWGLRFWFPLRGELWALRHVIVITITALSY